MSGSGQAPLARIPLKPTEEVDLSSAVGHLILNSYGQEPKAFAEQLSVLDRSRQDAVRGAGSDVTARDLLYKWFHMLEMLELRFPELRAPFPWKDAFTSKGITQHSLAYEKASVIFNIASVLSSIGARTPRIGSGSAVSKAADATSPASTSSPLPGNAAPSAATAASGTKLAYTSFRQAAGMLSYINDNFLHAPSTDMSKDVVRWLVNLQLAQATEVFWERTLEEKKGGNLVTRIASQAATLYSGLGEDAKEWITRGVFERSWGLLTQTKAKYFASVAQYHRALVDDAAASHGSCLVRLTLAETLAKEAQKLCATFASAATASSSASSDGTLPADAGSSLKSIIDAHLSLSSERKATAIKDNDLIYHDILPTESTLPAIEPMAVAQPISIQEIYSSADVQKVTGATSAGTPASDLFSALVPLGVHEAASMYSEEKAKIVRGESERVSLADGQLEAALESMTLPRGLNKFKADGVQDLVDPGSEVREWADEEIQGGGSRGEDGLGTGSDVIDDGLRNVQRIRQQARQDLDEATRYLDEETAVCEKLRVKHGDRWTQSPSGLEGKALRSDLKTNRDALRQAIENDDSIEKLWRESEPMIRILLGGPDALEGAFAEAVTGATSGGAAGSQLVDLLQDDSGSEAQREDLRKNISTIEGHLSALQRIKRDRANTLTDLRSRIQADDISQVLILNRRASSDAQTQLFQQELEKFRPVTQHLARTIAEQDRFLADLSRLWKLINDAPVGRSMAQEWNSKNRSREQLVASLRRAKDANAQVRAGLSKGLAFYTQLQEIATGLRQGAKAFTEERGIERKRLLSELELHESSRGSFGGPTAQPSRDASSSSLEGAFDRMGLGDRGYLANQRQGSLGPTSFPPPPPQLSSLDRGLASPSSPIAPYHASSPPPPQRPIQQQSPYDNLDAAFGPNSGYRSQGPPPPGPPLSSPAAPQGPYANQSGYSVPPYGQQPPLQSRPTSSFQAQAPHHQTFPTSDLRQPSLPPPPPQWQSSTSYGGQGPPPPPLPSSAQKGYGMPPPLPHQSASQGPYNGYPNDNHQGSYNNGPPIQQQQRYAGYGGPQPPPMQPPPGQAYGYTNPPYPTLNYGSGPPPPPPPQQQPRWQPPY